MTRRELEDIRESWRAVPDTHSVKRLLRLIDELLKERDNARQYNHND